MYLFIVPLPKVAARYYRISPECLVVVYPGTTSPSGRPRKTYDVHTLYSVHWTLYSVHTAYSVWRTACNVRRTIYVAIHPTVYGVHRTHGIQCTLYIVQCIQYSVYSTEYTVQCTMYSVLYSEQCTVYTVHCTVQSVQLYDLIPYILWRTILLLYSVRRTMYIHTPISILSSSYTVTRIKTHRPFTSFMILRNHIWPRFDIPKIHHYSNLYAIRCTIYVIRYTIYVVRYMLYVIRYYTYIIRYYIVNNA